MYTFSSLRDHNIPKSLKCSNSAPKIGVLWMSPSLLWNAVSLKGFVVVEVFWASTILTVLQKSRMIRIGSGGLL